MVERTTARKENVLHTAAYSNNNDFFKKINGIDNITTVYNFDGTPVVHKINVKYAIYERNPLHYAKKGEIAKAILNLYDSKDQEYKIGEHDRWGFTPLHYASYLGLDDVVEAMLKHVPRYSNDQNYFKTDEANGRNGSNVNIRKMLQIGMDEKYVEMQHHYH